MTVIVKPHNAIIFIIIFLNQERYCSMFIFAHGNKLHFSQHLFRLFQIFW